MSGVMLGRNAASAAAPQASRVAGRGGGRRMRAARRAGSLARSLSGASGRPVDSRGARKHLTPKNQMNRKFGLRKDHGIDCVVYELGYGSNIYWRINRNTLIFDHQLRQTSSRYRYLAKYLQAISYKTKVRNLTWTRTAFHAVTKVNCKQRRESAKRSFKIWTMDLDCLFDD